MSGVVLPAEDVQICTYVCSIGRVQRESVSIPGKRFREIPKYPNQLTGPSPILQQQHSYYGPPWQMLLKGWSDITAVGPELPNADKCEEMRIQI